MQVIKRNGKQEEIRLDKITDRVRYLARDLSIDPVGVALKVMTGIHDGITSKQIDQLLSETAAVLTIQNPDYAKLAGRILVSSLHKETVPSFYESMKKLKKAELLDEQFYRKVRQHRDALDKLIVHERDFDLDYTGIKTLAEGYLMSVDDQVIERPQHLWMRVAVAITVNDDGIETAKELYNLFSTGLATHATPTLYNAGTRYQQLSSCFLVPIEDDSMDAITRAWTTFAMISREAGGIGTYITKLRGTGSRIRKRGISKGIIPPLRVANAISEYVDQGGRRPGTIAVYLEPWHNDIFEFIDIKKNTGEEKSRARSLFSAMWIPDLFMKRVEENAMWSLFSPSQIDVDLSELYDEEVTGGSFTREYTRLEAEGKYVKQVKARDLWSHILNAQSEGGRPYILYKDTINRTSNYKHIGTIRGSNLCCLAADQRVATNKGLLTVKELFDDARPNMVAGRDGVKSATSMRLLRTNTEMVKIQTREGYSHKVTPDHKVWIKDFGWKEAKDLIVGDKIVLQQNYDLHGPIHLPEEAFVCGMIAGDGTFHRGKNAAAIIDIWENEFYLKERLQSDCKYIISKTWHKFSYRSDAKKSPTFIAATTKLGSSKKLRLNSKPLYDALNLLGFNETTKLKVPNFVWAGDKETVAAYLEGIFVSDGTTQADENITTCSLCSINRAFLEEIQILLMCLGIKSFINSDNRVAAEFRLWPDGKWYNSQPKCRLLVTSIRGCKLVNELTHIGEHRGNITWLENIKKDGYQQKFECTVEGVIGVPNEDAYCLEVDSEDHAFTVNGMITKNCEIVEFHGIAKDTGQLETAVCNLASIPLQNYVSITENSKTSIDYDKLGSTVRTLVSSLNKVIDITHYPVQDAKRSNLRHRPIAIGVQGLADVFFLHRVAFDSKEASEINKKIFECIYYNALVESSNLAEIHGPYPAYKGSPVSQGILHIDNYKIDKSELMYDWDAIRERIKVTGLFNALLIALMPTQSTANLFGSVEGFEAQPANIYRKRLTWGEPIWINRYLVSELTKLGLWTDEIRNKILTAEGSIQHISEIPADIRSIYKCASLDEISQKQVIEMAAARQPFVDQSQSMNLYFMKPTPAKLHSAHMHSWRLGCKTGMYYLRTNSTANAVKVTTTQQPTPVKVEYTAQEKLVCSINNPEDCKACGS